MTTKLLHTLRLYSGLAIALFLVVHLSTAALGLISVSAMDSVGRVTGQVLSNPAVLLILYGSFGVHITMGLVALFNHRTWRLPLWNLLQIALGLALPLLLIGHAVGTRGAEQLLDIQLSYSEVLVFLWSSPETVIRQYALVMIAWFHMCLGIHYWLRNKPGYSTWVVLLYPLCILIPVLAGLGFARAGFDTVSLPPETVIELTAALNAADPAAIQFLSLFSDRLLQLFILLVVLVFGMRIVRDRKVQRHGDFSVTHTLTAKTARGTRGQSVLEVLRDAGIAHASVCGGRGRCTTCRIRVVDDNARLPPPASLEAAALLRVGAAPNVRLACQLRPGCDIAITPVLQASISAAKAGSTAAVVGQEQPVVCMFVDMRGSTSLAEKKMPYDVVFILNLFFIQLADALKVSNGHYANFTGDGVMGLYGLNSDIQTGCREALQGAIEIQHRMNVLNGWLSDELDIPLEVGIGIHCGVAIVGTMGPPDAPITSAIGDNINIAARLEALTKEFATNLVISKDVLSNASVDYSRLPSHTAPVRGRGEPVEVFIVKDAASLLSNSP